MELTQRKLSQKEWESLEIPIVGHERRILNMIKSGYDNLNISFNNTQTIINFIKLDPQKKKLYDSYIYLNYFQKSIDTITKTKNFNIEELIKNKKKIILKKADQIRIKNMETKLETIKNNIFEFILIDLLEKFIKSKKELKNKYYYTILKLFTYSIDNVNGILKDNIILILSDMAVDVNKEQFIENAYYYIERNDILSKFKDIKLFPHQRKLFNYCGIPESKLVFYQAPTGTGKTLSPIGLSQKYKIIFVCAAKHVGLQLAKACISLDIKIAVAFGCKDPGNIRLHWNAAKESIRNRKTGGIFKVDNSVGDNVEIIICDVMSYIPAMHYMSAFNKFEDMILFWDEPTITLDYEKHEYHKILSKNWRENEIPNIVLSSATLPRMDELEDMISSFTDKFGGMNITTITSYDCTKTIPILNTENKVVLPHLLYPTYNELRESLSHIKNCKTLLRHFDIREISKFITYVNDNVELKERLKIDNYFEKIESIDIISIKKYYLLLLNSIGNDYEKVHKHLVDSQKSLFESSIKLTTSDAHTLTDGPTIYLADNVDKIGMYCLKTAEIPSVMASAILQDIKSNEKIRLEIEKIMKEIKKNKDEEKEKEKENEKTSGIETKQEQLLEKCEYLRTEIRPIQLGLQFIPNHREHLNYWNKQNVKNAFTSNVEANIVEKIMLLEVSTSRKILLLMGIGVFSQDTNDDYVAIMKELAIQQKLYLIIASTDYIYGTNYQFCHGYIGKDLNNMSQEKIIQALGRVGRSDSRKDYSIRLRYNNIIETIFKESTNKIEVKNMNLLFC